MTGSFLLEPSLLTISVKSSPSPAFSAPFFGNAIPGARYKRLPSPSPLSFSSFNSNFNLKVFNCQLKGEDGSPDGGCTRKTSTFLLKLLQPKQQKIAASILPLFLTLAVLGSQPLPESGETFENVPQLLSGDDKRPARIQRPKSAKAESCTRKCVGTCIRGGAGAPGEGPLNVRKPLVVFKEGFRSRQYCLVECSDICNLIDGKDDGP